MADLLYRMNGGELIGFFAVVGGVCIALSAILGGLWTAVRQAEFHTRQVEIETGLKQDMLNRGMSVDEIERVLAAGKAKAPDSPETSSCKRGERKSCV